MDYEFIENDLEILNEFVQESKESIEQAEQILIGLEQKIIAGNEIDSDAINRIFRTFHSIKGSAGFIGLPLTNKITHKTESVLDQIRKGKTELNKTHISVLLEVCDFFNSLLNHLSEKHTESGYDGSSEKLIKRLDEFTFPEEQRQLKKGTRKRPLKGKSNSDKQKEISKRGKNKGAQFEADMAEQFIMEARELLDEIESNLLALERQPENRQFCENALRAMNNLKEYSETCDYQDIALICQHEGGFLQSVRSGNRRATAENFTFMLEIIEFVISRPHHVNIADVLVLPQDQASSSIINKK